MQTTKMIHENNKNEVMRSNITICKSSEIVDLSSGRIGSANLPKTIHQSVWWVSMCLFKVFVLFKMPMTVSHELFERFEHLMLNISIKCLICEIKHEIALQSKEHTD